MLRGSCVLSPIATPLARRSRRIACTHVSTLCWSTGALACAACRSHTAHPCPCPPPSRRFPLTLQQPPQPPLAPTALQRLLLLCRGWLAGRPQADAHPGLLSSLLGSGHEAHVVVARHPPRVAQVLCHAAGQGQVCGGWVSGGLVLHWDACVWRRQAGRKRCCTAACLAKAAAVLPSTLPALLPALPALCRSVALCPGGIKEASATGCFRSSLSMAGVAALAAVHCRRRSP